MEFVEEFYKSIRGQWGNDGVSIFNAALLISPLFIGIAISIFRKPSGTAPSQSSLPRNPDIKTVHEIRVSCKACGSVTFQDPRSSFQNLSKGVSEFSSALEGVVVAFLGIIAFVSLFFFWPLTIFLMILMGIFKLFSGPKRPQNNPAPVDRCQKCGSKAIVKDSVVHEFTKS